MVISVNGHPLALKKGSSFEYISENRLFSGSDAYTLSITFPLKDCPQNIEIFGHINRKDVSLGKIIFDCEIRDKSFYKFGSLTVVEISDTEVKCQFLEGRSETNYDKTFDKIYINELDLGAPEITDPSKIEPRDAISPTAMDFKYVALPWVNNNSDSGLPHNFINIHQVGDTSVYTYSWDEETKDVTWQPFLNYIISKICECIGYEIDLTELEKDVTSRYLIICNTLPGTWNIPEFARALPHWTVEEFFQKLELFLGGEFNIDHRNRKISFKFSNDIIEGLEPVSVKNVVEEFSSQVDYEEPDCDYLGVKNLAYKEDDSEAWKYYSCDWFINERKDSLLEYGSLKELIKDNKSLARWWSWEQRKLPGMTKLLYAKDVDCYYIVRSVSYIVTTITGFGSEVKEYKCVLQPVNTFGKRNGVESDVEEIEFLPVPIDYTDDDHEFCMFLSPGSYSETINSYHDIPMDGMTGTQNSLLAGAQNGNSEYYDRIYIAWWPGVTRPEAKMPYPIVNKIEPKSDWSGYYNWVCFDMRLAAGSTYHSVIHNIDPKRKVSFKFLADTVPDVRAVFFIHGKRYICEKITATFTESGMSQLLKGDFYQIID